MALPTKKLVLLLMLLTNGALAADMYCCQDPRNGRRACADGLPEQCRGRPYVVLDSGGNVIREVEGTLTPEQKAQRAAEAQRKKEEQDAIQAQRRKDQALLDTYSSLQDIEIARNRAEGVARESLRQAEEKVASLREQHKKWETEAEFYKKKTMPPEVEQGLRQSASEIKAYTHLLESKTKDLETIRAKYDEDKRRYLSITSRAPAQPQPAPPSAAR